MSNVLQKSYSRGSFRKPLVTLATSDVHSQIVFDRPDPIKLGWFSGWSQWNIQAQPLPQTGYGPGALYFVVPTPAEVNAGVGATQLWLNTGTTQAAGIGNWTLVFFQSAGSSGSGGGDGSGSGGGDGGDG